MSLLLDARKKSQHAQSAQGDDHALPDTGLSLEEHPSQAAAIPDATGHGPQSEEMARHAGHNLFAAKSSLHPAGHTPPNRNLLLALGGTILLLGAGAGYLWYADSASDTRPLRPIDAPPAAQLAQAQPALANTATTQPGDLVPGIAAADIAAGTLPDQSMPAEPPVESKPAPRTSSSIRIEQQRVELVDPLLRDAYLAYRNGKPDEAQQLYLAMFKKDAHNADALLGLAAIAQQRGDNQMAAQYFAGVLLLDPRNAVANAGMSSLSADEDGNDESRLKTLLREQGNSAALHFALGNLYAEQSRWGEAQQAYFNAYTLESGNAEYAFNLAVSLDQLGQGKLAAQHYQRALQLDQSRSAGFDHAQIEQRVQELTR